MKFKLPVTEHEIEFLVNGVKFNGTTLDESIKEILPSTIELTPNSCKVVSNQGYIEIKETGITILKNIAGFKNPNSTTGAALSGSHSFSVPQYVTSTATEGTNEVWRG